MYILYKINKNKYPQARLDAIPDCTHTQRACRNYIYSVHCVQLPQKNTTDVMSSLQIKEKKHDGCCLNRRNLMFHSCDIIMMVVHVRLQLNFAPFFSSLPPLIQALNLFALLILAQKTAEHVHCTMYINPDVNKKKGVGIEVSGCACVSVIPCRFPYECHVKQKRTQV